MRRLLLICFIIGLLLPPFCLARDVAIITDKKNVAPEVSSKQLLKLLRTETRVWPSGQKVTVYLSNPSSADGKLLLEKVYKITLAEFQSLAVSQKNNIVILGSDDLVLRAVAEHPGAIGVVNVYSINSAVTVVKVDGKLPLQQGYLLHGN
ncbi:MAG TPA: hypothetical protein VF532_08905 [Candidatus Angelobacter sp.]